MKKTNNKSGTEKEINKLKQEITGKLKKVLDPHTGIDVFSMGMIKNISINKGEVTIKFKPTSPFCPILDYLIKSMENSIKKIKEIKKLEIKVVA